MLRSYLGTSPTLGERVYIDPQSCVIGRVTIGDDSSVWPMAVIRGDVNVINIGARTSVQDGSVLHVSHEGPLPGSGARLTIGDDVTIGHCVVLHGCTVGSRVLIGMHSTVLDKAVIEDEVLLAAGSLVPPGKRLVSGYLYRGAPAEQARALSARERQQLRESAGHYLHLKNEYLGESAKSDPKV